MKQQLSFAKKTSLELSSKIRILKLFPVAPVRHICINNRKNYLCILKTQMGLV